MVAGAYMKVIKYFCIFCLSWVNAVYSINAFAVLGNEAGGLTLVNAEDIEVISQDLYVSVGSVKSTYIFKNIGKNDILTEVKLTLPE